MASESHTTGIANNRQKPSSKRKRDMKFSVVICCYNNEPYIGAAIRSVIANDDPDTEIIVVDDGSTDRSREVIMGIDHPSIKPVFKENGGQASAFNAGVANSDGDVLCFLDGDDFFTPLKIPTLRQVITENNLVGKPYLIRHPLLRLGPKRRVREKRAGWGHSLTGHIEPEHGKLVHLMSPDAVRTHIRRYGFYTYPGGNASVFSREIAQIVFPVPEHVSKFYGDYFPAMGSCVCGDVYLYGSALGVYRFHESNHSSKRKKYTSAHFQSATDAYLNEVLARIGAPERVDFFGSKYGVRYLCESGRSMTALRIALSRAIKLKDSRSITDLGRAVGISVASALRLIPHATREAGD
jgi:glycosyltransferase involved in cell wall biosynthesis